MNVQSSNIYASNLPSFQLLSHRGVTCQDELAYQISAHEPRADKGLSGKGAASVVSEEDCNLILT